MAYLLQCDYELTCKNTTKKAGDKIESVVDIEEGKYWYHFLLEKTAQK